MPVILALIAMNLVVSLLGFRALQNARTAEGYLFIPAQVVRGENLVGMLRSSFAHAGWGHLGFNMLSFFFFAPAVARLGGQGILLLVYFVAMFGADLLVLIMRAGNPAYRALGASGAVSGVIFAAIVFDPSIDVFFFFIPIPIPGPVFAVAYVALSLLLSRREGGGTSHEAHAGGALAGFAAAALAAPHGLAPLWGRVSGMLTF